ncbi:helix-turn-helix domain-containing protein [Cellvibrio polysaccharolyticus]|uniref:helix-turn-helix domain-containing protein n=1 Tax=Cellvibrio polysaccharolyticus TaxID=2082724 RepID=UPI001881B7AE|nr:helix-turn-helix transcriptional regulator [Cellvibrio polysaccharolyticus]
MIVRKLRDERKWSQEQLAILSGLSIRTIQRVESGQSASLETLKSLASVFDVEISKLTEEITMIDKKAEVWRSQPWWFRWSFFGVPSRRVQLALELLALLVGIGAIFVADNHLIAPAFLLAAYFTGWTVRYGDSKKVW